MGRFYKELISLSENTRAHLNMSGKRLKCCLQRQAQTRLLDTLADVESLSQYSLSSARSIQTPRATNVVEIRESSDGVQKVQPDTKDER